MLKKSTPLFLSSRNQEIAEGLLEGAVDDGRVIGVDLAVVALQVVEDLTEEQELEPAGGLALQDKTKDVVELGKLDDFTVLDSRACVLADMMPLENGDRDALHSTTDKLLKELQRERC